MNFRFSMLLLTITFLSIGITANAADPGLTVSSDGVLLKNGKPYRAIGVNYVNAFTRVPANPDFIWTDDMRLSNQQFQRGKCEW